MAKIQHQHSNCIVEHSMLNGLQMNLKDAIESAGVTISKSDCLWQYPEIIRNNLIAKTINNVNFLGKDIIKVYQTTENDELIYNISTIYDTKDVKRPNYALKNNDWGELLSIDSIFNDLFKNILPEVRGIHAGDMTTTNDSGNDIKEWNNTLFNKSGNKSGLLSNSKYLRLYLTCQAEPLYILIDSDISNITCNYNVADSDTVDLKIDKTTMTLTAHVASITDEQLNTIE